MFLWKHLSANVKKALFSDFVLTHTQWSETFWYPEVRNSLIVNLVQKLSKLVNICKSYCKTFTGTFLWTTMCIYVCVYHPYWPLYTSKGYCRENSWYISKILLKEVLSDAVHIYKVVMCWWCRFCFSNTSAHDAGITCLKAMKDYENQVWWVCVHVCVSASCYLLHLISIITRWDCCQNMWLSASFITCSIQVHVWSVVILS